MPIDSKDTRLPNSPKWALYEGSEGIGIVCCVISTVESVPRTVAAFDVRPVTLPVIREMVAARNLLRNQREPQAVDVSPLFTNPFAEDAAELIGVAAAATCESTRLHWEAMKAMQAGEHIPAIDNPYMDVLVDMLRGRNVIPDHPIEEELGAALRDAKSELDERLAQRIVARVEREGLFSTEETLAAVREEISRWYEPTDEGDADATA